MVLEIFLIECCTVYNGTTYDAITFLIGIIQNKGTHGVQESFFCEVSEIEAFMELFTPCGGGAGAVRV